MDIKKLKSYEFVIIAIIISTGILLLRKDGLAHPNTIWFVRGIFVVALLAAIRPTLFYPLAQGLQFLTRMIGWLTNKILLSIVFFIFLAPLARLRKVFQKKQQNPATNWIVRNKTFQAEDLKNQF